MVRIRRQHRVSSVAVVAVAVLALSGCAGVESGEHGDWAAQDAIYPDGTEPTELPGFVEWNTGDGLEGARVARAPDGKIGVTTVWNKP